MPGHTSRTKKTNPIARKINKSAIAPASKTSRKEILARRRRALDLSEELNDSFIIHNEGKLTEACSGIVVGIINNAISDMVSTPNRMLYKSDIISARKYLVAHCEYHCDLVGIDHDWLVRKIEKADIGLHDS